MAPADRVERAGEPAGERRSGSLLLVRHGQSQANADDLFAGWLDVPLTARGEHEAVRAADLMAENGLLPGAVHTSLLSRSIRTADILLGQLGRPWLPTQRTWRLNERHYGALQGRNKAAVRESVSDATFRQWRRAFRGRPPLADDSADIERDPRYARLPPDALPRGESLADVQARMLPYFYDIIAGQLYSGLTPLIVAHGSPLRALIMHLDGIDEQEVAGLNIPTGVPLRYDLDAGLRPRIPGGTYLDPAAAIAGAAEVAAQGGGPAPEPRQ